MIWKYLIQFFIAGLIVAFPIMTIGAYIFVNMNSTLAATRDYLYWAMMMMIPVFIMLLTLYFLTDLLSQQWSFTIAIAIYVILTMILIYFFK